MAGQWQTGHCDSNFLTISYIQWQYGDCMIDGLSIPIIKVLPQIRFCWVLNHTDTVKVILVTFQNYFTGGRRQDVYLHPLLLAQLDAPNNLTIKHKHCNWFLTKKKFTWEFLFLNWLGNFMRIGKTCLKQHVNWDLLFQDKN